MNTARGWQLRLADEFFLAAHIPDTTHMRPRLPPVVLNLGLAGALLAELIMANRIAQLEGYLVAVNPAARGAGGHQAGHDGDAVTERIMQRIATQTGQPASVWLEKLRDPAADGVRNRLVVAGILHASRSRSWWGGTAKHYEAADPNIVMVSEARVFRVVTRAPQAPVTLGEATLAGLADATGLRDKISGWDRSATQIRNRMAELRSGLPAQFRELLADLERVVGAALLSTGHH